jgi:hypothetical protein
MGWATLRAAANRVALDRLGSVSIAAGGASGRGFISEESQLEMGDAIISLDRMVTAEAALFRALGYGDAVTVAGAAYQVVHEPFVIGDGTWCRIPLKLLQVAPPTLQIFRLVAADTGQPLVTADTGQPLQTQPI